MSDIFSPATLGPVRLPNRIVKAATFEGMTREGHVTDELVRFHRRHAEGGVGMSTLAYCAVAPEGRTERHQLWMRPELIPDLRRLTDAVHGSGAAVSAQLGHAGPVANAASNRLPALAPHRMPNPLGMSMTQAATPADLQRVTQAHADAAGVAVEAGFDAVELHFGHNYLVSSFLSPLLNRRGDDYGGSTENRARLARATARAVRDEVGDRVAITVKLNLDDGVPGGFWVDESIQVARWLEADGSVDAITLTAGSSLLNPLYTFTGDAPRREFAATFPPRLRWAVRLGSRLLLREYPYENGYLLDRARQVRAEVSLPLVLLGGVGDRETMELARSSGFEFVAMARALLREPDLPNKMRADASIRSLCIHCNKCVPTIYTGTHCVLAPNAV